MNQIKKRHHYVWRQYLRSWSNQKNLIPALIKCENKIATPNLMGVAQEKFYYSLEDFTVEEEIILKQLILNLSNEDTKKVNLEFFNLFTSYSRMRRSLKNESSSTITKTEVEEKLNWLRSNLMEDFHADFESFGHRLINIRKMDDLDFLNDQDSLMQTFIFLCYQYMRTKKMKKAFAQKFQNHPTILPKYFHIISFVLGAGMANGLKNYKNTKFIYLENKSSIDFITSDQPIINLKEDEKDDKGNVRSLDFFYPINPRIALKIHYKEEGLKFEKALLYKEDIESYNQIIFEKSDDFIFSSSTAQLEFYKKQPINSDENNF